MDYIIEAQNALESFHSMPEGAGEPYAQSAIAAALIAIAEELRKMNDTSEAVRIEANRDQAIAQLRDANMLASTLVGLIRRTVAKAKSLAEEGAQNEKLTTDDWAFIEKTKRQLGS